MRRATTPTHKFTLPFSTSYIKKILITYAQDDKIVVEKTEEEVATEGTKVVSITLSQQETLKFNPDKSVRIQVRVLTHDDKALASQIYTRPCDDVLNSEILV